VTVEFDARPRGPYSLALSARLAGDATRSFRDGVFTAALRTSAGGQLAFAYQRPDGSLRLRGEGEDGIAELLRILALDDDHSEFVRQFSDDPFLGKAVRRLRGLRPIRLATVTQALLRALCGQLIESSRARSLERTIVRRTTPTVPGTRFHLAPTSAELAGLAPAQLRALGLHARRGATLVRICGALDLERLCGVPTSVAAARLERERGLGPWSVGVICLEGLGRWERGLVADLGLVKLCSTLRGRRVEPEETAELLEPYGDWAGLASVYMLAGYARGLLPLPTGSRTRRSATTRFAA
jgi:3-methyladenine DNA glycosylase/8-oxoguanine DNA glycosylase